MFLFKAEGTTEKAYKFLTTSVRLRHAKIMEINSLDSYRLPLLYLLGCFPATDT
jgi:hypothetical protein